MTEKWLWVALAWASISMVATGRADVQGPGWESVQRVGPPRMYSPSVERYRYGHTDVDNPEFYPLPQESVTRESYLRCIDETRPADIARWPNRGMDGPRAFMPVLVKYV